MSGFQGLNDLGMGNGNSLSAGIDIEDGNTAGVRHRATSTKTVCASIVEGISGAYISREAFSQDSNILTERMLSEAVHNTDWLPPVKDSEATLAISQSSSDVIDPLREMSDSGYLEVDDDCRNSTLKTNQDGVFHRESSEVSSLSDQHLRDLCSDTRMSELSSSRSSYQHRIDELDEDILCAEFIEDEPHDSDTPMVTLTENMLGPDDLEHSQTSTDTTLTNESLTACQHQFSDMYSDSPTELAGQQSSLLAFIREDGCSSRPSSVFSSPLFGTVSIGGHSRSSSITSADIDLEATSMEEDEVG